MNNVKERYQDDKGNLHRLDGPATVYNNGDEAWYKHGKLHREDGPAIENADGSKEWWVNGNRHRLDGPAVEWRNGTKAWWVNGELHRLDGPAVETSYGTKEWWVNGKLHREDGPAVETNYGTKKWYIEGQEVSEFDVSWYAAEWTYHKMDDDTMFLSRRAEHGGAEMFKIVSHPYYEPGEKPIIIIDNEIKFVQDLVDYKANASVNTEDTNT